MLIDSEKAAEYLMDEQRYKVYKDFLIALEHYTRDYDLMSIQLNFGLEDTVKQMWCFDALDDKDGYTVSRDIADSLMHVFQTKVEQMKNYLEETYSKSKKGSN